MLRLENKSRRDFSGRVTTLLVHDTQSLFFLLTLIHNLWSAPVTAVLVGVMMGYFIGAVPAICSMLVLVCAVGTMIKVNDSIKILETKVKSTADKRVTTIQETLAGIGVVKMYNWEKSLGENINTIRNTELRYIFQLAVCRALLFVSFLLTPILMSIVAFERCIYFPPHFALI